MRKMSLGDGELKHDAFTFHRTISFFFQSRQLSAADPAVNNEFSMLINIKAAKDILGLRSVVRRDHDFELLVSIRQGLRLNFDKRVYFWKVIRCDLFRSGKRLSWLRGRKNQAKREAEDEFWFHGLLSALVEASVVGGAGENSFGTKNG